MDTNVNVNMSFQGKPVMSKDVLLSTKFSILTSSCPSFSSTLFPTPPPSPFPSLSLSPSISHSPSPSTHSSSITHSPFPSTQLSSKPSPSITHSLSHSLSMLSLSITHIPSPSTHSLSITHIPSPYTHSLSITHSSSPHPSPLSSQSCNHSPSPSIHPSPNRLPSSSSPGSSLCFSRSTSPPPPAPDQTSTSTLDKQNDVNARIHRVSQSLYKLNIHCKEEESSDESSDESTDSSESSSDVHSTEPNTRVITLRTRGPNGNQQQQQSARCSAYRSNAHRTNIHERGSQINWPSGSPESSLDAVRVAAESGNISFPSLLESLNQTSSDDADNIEQQIGGFLRTPPNSALPQLQQDDLESLLGSCSPGNVSSTSDYGSLPASPFETNAGGTSPVSITTPNSTTPQANLEAVHILPRPEPAQHTVTLDKIRSKYDQILLAKNNSELLQTTPTGNSELTISLAKMAHGKKYFDPCWICAIIDFVVERKPELLWMQNVKNETPLLIACGIDFEPIIARYLAEALIRIGHDFTETYDGELKNSLFHYMVRRSDRCNSCLEEILKLHTTNPLKGLDINSFNADGWTPLHLAVLNLEQNRKAAETVSLLIDYGANPCIGCENRSCRGSNAIHLAVKRSAMPQFFVETILTAADRKGLNAAKLAADPEPGNLSPIEMAEQRRDVSQAEQKRLIHSLLRLWTSPSSTSQPVLPPHLCKGVSNAINSG